MKRSFEKQFDIGVNVINETMEIEDKTEHDDYTEYLESHMDYTDDYSEACFTNNKKRYTKTPFALSVISQEIERKKVMLNSTCSHTDEHADGPVHTDVK
jgi:hypothetical protein